jgi:hypothetical protein
LTPGELDDLAAAEVVGRADLGGAICVLDRKVPAAELEAACSLPERQPRVLVAVKGYGHIPEFA